MVTYFLNKEMQMNESADENESLVSALTKSWLTLDYRKDPGFKAGEAFPLRRTD